jgi:hypothetical protein
MINQGQWHALQAFKGGKTVGPNMTPNFGPGGQHFGVCGLCFSSMAQRQTNSPSKNKLKQA